MPFQRNQPAAAEGFVVLMRGKNQRTFRMDGYWSADCRKQPAAQQSAPPGAAFFFDCYRRFLLGRTNFSPRRTFGRVELHAKDAPNFNDDSSRLDLFLRGLAWFADYEQWIARRMPDSYREQCLTEFPRKALPRHEFTARWKTLANRIAWDQEAQGRELNDSPPPEPRILAVPGGDMESLSSEL